MSLKVTLLSWFTVEEAMEDVGLFQIIPNFRVNKVGTVNYVYHHSLHERHEFNINITPLTMLQVFLITA